MFDRVLHTVGFPSYSVSPLVVKILLKAKSKIILKGEYFSAFLSLLLVPDPDLFLSMALNVSRRKKKKAEENDIVCML